MTRNPDATWRDMSTYEKIKNLALLYIAVLQIWSLAIALAPYL